MREIDTNTTEKFKIPAQPKTIEHIELGRIEQVELRSTLSPFTFAPEYVTSLPPNVIQAIGNLLTEHAEAFSHFVPRNKEGDLLAYEHCIGPNGIVVEPFFQVDMVAVDRDFLSQTQVINIEEITQTVRANIFEFEPSIAMYELIQTFAGLGMLKEPFRAHLQKIRHRHGKPIALLAPTQEKFEAVLATEFGLPINHGLNSMELAHVVQETSGFDTILGPDEFIEHITENNNQCSFLLYVRPSDPIAKLKDPTVVVNDPLLGNDWIRAIIRRNAITLNIDNPRWSAKDPRRIKDSKVTLPLMGMGSSIRSADQLSMLHTGEESILRAKPRGGVFGAYGQRTIEPNNGAHRQWLEEQIANRGTYILQPEMAPLMVIDKTSLIKYLAMDRNFFSMVNDTPEFMGGVRILIPVDSSNAKNGRLHGSNNMVSAPIIAG